MEGYIPYLDPCAEPETRASRHSRSVPALGASVAPNVSGVGELRCWCHISVNATNFYTDFPADGGPPVKAVRRRVTYDLHSRNVIGDLDNYQQFRTEVLSGDVPNGPRDILTYVYYIPSAVADTGLAGEPSGVNAPGCVDRAPRE